MCHREAKSIVDRDRTTQIENKTKCCKRLHRVTANIRFNFDQVITYNILLYNLQFHHTTDLEQQSFAAPLSNPATN